jgi:NitT/TauT family transport system substrate-binding protein
MLFTFVLSACGGAGESTSTEETGTAVSGEPIKIAYSPWPGWFFWDLVEQKGFFEKHGVNVELVWFPVYSDSLAALSTGQVDANSQTLSDTIAPLSKGISLKAVLVNDNSDGGDAIVTKPDVMSVADLKGKTVATELGTVDHFLLLTALEQNGMTEKDINYVNMTVNDAGPAFITGKVEAAVLWEPFQTTAVKEGKGKVLFSSKDTPGLIPDLLVFKEETVNERADDVQKIIDAWFDALAWYEQNPDEAIEIMAKKAEISAEEFKLSLESIKLFDVDDNIKAFEPGDSYDSLHHTGAKTAEFLKKLEMISDIPDVSAALEPKFVQAAKK